MRRGSCLALVSGMVLALASLVPAARAAAGNLDLGAAAPPAPSSPDTSLDRYLGGLRDSTETFFRQDTLRFDTTGVDSMARVFTRTPSLGPKGPGPEPFQRPLGLAARISSTPGREFYAAPVARAGLDSRGPGAVRGTAGWSTQQHQWFDALGWSRTVRPGGRARGPAVGLHLAGYRSLGDLDARAVSPDPGLLPVLEDGRRGDLRYRRIGWLARAGVHSPRAALDLRYRHEESADLVGVEPESAEVVNGTPAGRAAARGVTDALAASGGLATSDGTGYVRMLVESGRFHDPGAPGPSADGTAAPGSRSVEFSRLRLGAGRSLRLGRVALLGVLGEWAAASDQAPPQEQFSAGGPVARGFDNAAVFGRQLYLARAELHFAGDVLSVLRLRVLNPFQLTTSLFVESAAVPDVGAGHGLKPAWPRGGNWASDVGVSTYLLLGAGRQPLYVRTDLAMAVGPFHAGQVRVECAAGVTFPQW